MEPKDIIREFDMLLMVKGIRYYETSTRTHVMRLICQMLFITHYTSSMFFLFSQIKFSTESIFAFINIWFEVTLITMYLYFVLRRKRFLRLYEDAISLCSTQQMKDIRQMMRYLSLIGCLYGCFFLCSKLLAWYGCGTKLFLLLEFNVVIESVSFRHQLLAVLQTMMFAIFGWSAITVLIYIMNVYLIKKIFESFFAFASLASSKSYHQLRLHWVSLSQVSYNFFTSLFVTS